MKFYLRTFFDIEIGQCVCVCVCVCDEGDQHQFQVVGECQVGHSTSK